MVAVVVSFSLVRVDVRRGSHTGRVDRLKLFGVGKNVGELFGKTCFLFSRQLEMRERRNALDVGNGQRRGHVMDRCCVVL